MLKTRTVFALVFCLAMIVQIEARSLLMKRFLAGIIDNEPCGAFGCSSSQDLGSSPMYGKSKKKHKTYHSKVEEDPWDPKNFETGLDD
ncbi:unnamed protein product [Dimorphilus gyrociliatus]|uniref:Uncharacterized protein n=1 Tax=Dimorphilus gyrociliatus TaxID=2664684 RepID=A0A7I8V5D2_9ANNE|nr:unnamed protein product [Dimorphilus gyrociliatus]